MSKKTKIEFTPEEQDAIDKYLANPDYLMVEFAQYFENLDQLRANGEIPTKYVSFEVLKGFLAGLSSGVSNERLNDALPATLGKDTVLIPLSVLRDLVGAWDHYCNSPQPNLSKSFGFGGFKHERSILTKVEQIKTERYYARRIFELRLCAKEAGIKLTTQKAYEEVAEMDKVSIETIKRAYRKHRAHWEVILSKHGLPTK